MLCTQCVLCPILSKYLCIIIHVYRIFGGYRDTIRVVLQAYTEKKLIKSSTKVWTPHCATCSCISYVCMDRRSTGQGENIQHCHYYIFNVYPNEWRHLFFCQFANDKKNSTYGRQKVFVLHLLVNDHNHQFYAQCDIIAFYFTY